MCMCSLAVLPSIWFAEQETRMQRPWDPGGTGSWAWPLEAWSYCQEYCYQSGVESFTLWHLQMLLLKNKDYVQTEFYFVLSADEFFLVLLVVCCFNWTEGAVCGFWVQWHPAHIDRFDDYLPVHLLSIQWGNSGTEAQMVLYLQPW